MSKYDAVLSYHLNPLTCGVAKFNQELARRLGVPCAPLNSRLTYQYPLLSVKPSETVNWSRLGGIYSGRYDLLLHDRTLESSDEFELAGWMINAVNVFYADELGCPSTMKGHALKHGSIHVLTFGMAHKRCLSHFERLKHLLDQDGRSYTVGVSSAIHEGSPWAETWAESDATLRGLFGDHLRQYGFLADDGLVNAIDDANVVALFYDPAVRANNTTLWAAMERARVVITNLDEQSPRELVHGETVFDIAKLEQWPDQTGGLRWAGQQLARGRYGWDALIAQLASSRVDDSLTVSRYTI